MPQSNCTKSSKIVPIILCGGSGTRLWPLSSQDIPKQYLPLINKTILLHDTLNRAVECSGCHPSDIITITTEHLKTETIKQLQNFNPNTTNHVLFEPCRKNTAAAIAYTALYAKNIFGEDALLWILPADHYVESHNNLKQIIANAAKNKEANDILTFGIPPTNAETEYGYIRFSKSKNLIKKVTSFTEKPDKKTAEEYLLSNNYLWNSGMVFASVKSILNEFIEHSPQILSLIHEAINKKTISLTDAYNKIPSIPFDKAILEKTQNAVVIESNIGWSDVGSWRSIWNLKEKDQNGNVTQGNIQAIETENCFIHSNNLMIAAIGLQDIAIVEQGNSILIADKKNAQSMRLLSETFKTHRSATSHTKMAWGYQEILSEKEGYKSCELTILPQQTIPLHHHEHRAEFCTVLNGEATIVINQEIHKLSAQESLYIPIGTRHEIKNVGTTSLKIIEVQCGKTFDSDHIITNNDEEEKIA